MLFQFLCCFNLCVFMYTPACTLTYIFMGHSQKHFKSTVLNVNHDTISLVLPLTVRERSLLCIGTIYKVSFLFSFQYLSSSSLPFLLFSISYYSVPCFSIFCAAVLRIVRSVVKTSSSFILWSNIQYSLGD